MAQHRSLSFYLGVGRGGEPPTNFLKKRAWQELIFFYSEAAGKEGGDLF